MHLENVCLCYMDNILCLLSYGVFTAWPWGALGQDFSCSVSILAVLAKDSGRWWGTSDCLGQLQGATFYTDLLGDV